MADVLQFFSDMLGNIFVLLREKTAFIVGGQSVSFLQVIIWMFMLELLADFIVNFMNFGAGEAVRSSHKFVKTRAFETKTQRENRIVRKDLKKRGLIK